MKTVHTRKTVTVTVTHKHTHTHTTQAIPFIAPFNHNLSSHMPPKWKQIDFFFHVLQFHHHHHHPMPKTCLTFCSQQQSVLLKAAHSPYSRVYYTLLTQSVYIFTCNTYNVCFHLLVYTLTHIPSFLTHSLTHSLTKTPSPITTIHTLKLLNLMPDQDTSSLYSYYTNRSRVRTQTGLLHKS